MIHCIQFTNCIINLFFRDLLNIHKKMTEKSLLDDDLELKNLSIKELKALIKRSNIHSSWLSSSKKDIVLHLSTISTEWKRYVSSIIDFETVLAKGSEEVLQDWSMSGGIKRKKRKLRGRQVNMAPEVDVSASFKQAARNALQASVHIIPSGSGVFISDTVILTCAHCIDHDDDDDEGKYVFPKTRLNRIKEIVTPHRQTVGAKCIGYDESADLALLKILQTSKSPVIEHTFLKVSDAEPEQVFAIGNPYDIDLETDLKHQPTGFTPFWFSGGEYESVMKKASKRGLGRLKHSCWTYWGHSGCPLIAMEEKDGGIHEPLLTGIHNSWDDRNAQRHGVPLEEVKSFLTKNAHFL
uniref:Uncharacterized protein n=1 Tax=Clytia hemisphaerica TaxID=252671 RepID=A0A7M6DKX4_9CNID